MALFQQHFGRYVAYRPGDGSNQESVQDWYRLCSGNYQNRATLVLGFGPDDVALLDGYHGSSAIIAMAEASVVRWSVSFAGVCRYPATIDSPTFRLRSLSTKSSRARRTAAERDETTPSLTSVSICSTKPSSSRVTSCGMLLAYPNALQSNE